MALYVIRHGQVPSNVKGIISGWNDEELTDEGIEQAISMKEELQDIKFDEVYSSPIKRAVETAKIVVPQNEILFDSRLAERNPGSMLGQSRKNINKKEWNSLTKDRTREGVETLAAGLKRAKSFLDEKNDENKNILIVTHMFISKCIWVLKNNIEDEEQINSFFHNNGEVKYYLSKENRNIMLCKRKNNI